MTTTLLIHLYYPDSVGEIMGYLGELDKKENRFIFNVPIRDFHVHQKISEMILASFPEAIILNTSNRGKDIGGKLAMLNFYLNQEEKTDYLVFLHDKKSELTYTINFKKIDSEIWKKELFSIIHPENMNRIRKLFADPATGMVTHESHIYTSSQHSDYVIFGNNMLNLSELCDKFHLKNISEKKTDFAGGTMFWVRSKIYEDFFNTHPPLEIRAMLEKGNFTDRYSGTYSHAMERIFSWIVTAQGYQIKGI